MTNKKKNKNIFAISRPLFKSQFKRIWIFTLLISAIMVAYVAIGVVDNHFYDYFVVEPNSSGGHTGTFNFIRVTIFHSGGPALYTTYGFVMVLFLLVKDVEKGYLASWLTTPMSRNKIFFTKWSVFMTGFMLINAALIISQLALYGGIIQDFSKGIGRLLLSDLALIVFGFFWLNIMWFVGSIMPNNWSAVLVMSLLSAWFAIAAILGQGEFLFGPGPTAKIFEKFRYLTILSLLNDACKFTTEGSWVWSDGGIIETPRVVIPPIKAMDFAWQLPLMFVLGSGFATGSMFVLRHRSFNI